METKKQPLVAIKEEMGWVAVEVDMSPPHKSTILERMRRGSLLVRRRQKTTGKKTNKKLVISAARAPRMMQRIATKKKKDGGKKATLLGLGDKTVIPPAAIGSSRPISSPSQHIDKKNNGDGGSIGAQSMTSLRSPTSVFDIDSHLTRFVASDDNKSHSSEESQLKMNGAENIVLSDFGCSQIFDDVLCLSDCFTDFMFCRLQCAFPDLVNDVDEIMANDMYHLIFQGEEDEKDYDEGEEVGALLNEDSGDEPKQGEEVEDDKVETLLKPCRKQRKFGVLVHYGEGGVETLLRHRRDKHREGGVNEQVEDRKGGGVVVVVDGRHDDSKTKNVKVGLGCWAIICQLDNICYSPAAGVVLRKNGWSPELSADEVLIRVDAITLSTRNCLNSKEEFKDDVWVPGYEIVGRVVRAGKSAGFMFSLGEQIAALLPYGGGCSQYVCIDAKDAIAPPSKSSTDNKVALLSTYMTYQCSESIVVVQPEEEEDVESNEDVASNEEEDEVEEDEEEEEEEDVEKKGKEKDDIEPKEDIEVQLPEEKDEVKGEDDIENEEEDKPPKKEEDIESNGEEKIKIALMEPKGDEEEIEIEVKKRRMMIGLSDDEVLIRVDASTLSTRDCLERLRRDSKEELQDYIWVPGHEIVGHVVRAGVDAEFLLGERIAALMPHGGGCSQYVCINAQDAIALPDEAGSDELVALLSTYMTAYQCLESVVGIEPKVRENDESDEDVESKDDEDGEPREIPSIADDAGQKRSPLLGKNVLIVGAGSPVGLALVDLARNAGAVVYTLSHSVHLSAIREMGAKYWYSLSQKLWKEQWRGEMDLIVDTIGNSDYNPSFYKVMKTCGRLVRVNITSCDKKYVPIVGTRRNRKLRLSKNYKERVVSDKAIDYDVFQSFNEDKELFTEDLAYLHDMLQIGKIRPKIFSRVAFHELEDEWEKVMEGETKGGVVVVSPWKS